jgi:hypothetical protein
LAGGASDKQFKFWQRGRLDRRDVAITYMLREVFAVGLQCEFINLGVADALEINSKVGAGGVQAAGPAADPREEIEISDSHWDFLV